MEMTENNKTLLLEVNGSSNAGKHNDEMDHDGSKKTSFALSRYLLVAALTSLIPYFSYGYHIKAMPAAILSLKVDYDYTLTGLQEELLVSSVTFMAIFGGILGGQINDYCGRKYTIFFSLTSYFIGGIAMTVAPGKPSGWILILIGRTIIGIASGLCFMIGPVYLAECAHKQSRGKFIFFTSVAVSCGNIIVSSVSFGFSYLDNFWRYIFAVSLIFPLAGMILYVFLPESPRWLVGKGRIDEAKKALYKLRGKNTTELIIAKELDEIVRDLNEKTEENKYNIFRKLWIMIKNRHLLMALIVGCGFGIVRVSTAAGIISFYTSMIVNEAGLSSDSLSIGFVVVFSFFKLVFNFVGLCLVERLGRRLLTLISLTGIIIALALVSVSFLIFGITSRAACPTDMCYHNTCGDCVIQDDCVYCLFPQNASYSDNNTIGYCINVNSTSDSGQCWVPQSSHIDSAMHGTCNASHVISSYDDNYGSLYATCPDQSFWLTLVALLLFVSCYASGISAVTWTVTSEIYPNWSRSAANTVVYNTVNIGVLLSSVTFINFSQRLTYCGTFAIYACLSAAGWLFVFFLLPETKGKSLEDTESIFKGSLCPPPGLKSIFKSNKITEADANTNNYH